MKPLLVTILLIIFIAIGGFGFLYPMMDGHHHEPGCPYMPGEHAICAMSPIEHFSAWQKAFTVITPSLTSIMSLLVLVIVVSLLLTQSGPPHRKRRTTYFTFNYIPPINVYQMLFSKGILNPKAP